jgi:uncharacterized protein (TIGR02466 family)
LNLIDIFPTTIALHKLTSLDIPGALDLLKTLEYVNDQGNRGQYTENQNLLDNPLFTDTCKEIEEVCTEFAHSHGHQVQRVGVCSSWANRIPEGHIINRHVHSNSYICGCFYLTGGSPIEFFNIGLNDVVFNFNPVKNFDPTNFRTFGSFIVDIEPGQLLLFPSRLVHGVMENKGADRYSVSFNTLPVGLFGELTQQINWSK